MSDVESQYRHKSDMLLRKGRVKDALLILEHAILHLPNDISFLKDYTAIAMSLLEQVESEEKRLRLESLENFVRGRVPHVNFDLIDSVLACADDIAKVRSAADVATPKTLVEPALLAEVRAGRLGVEPPEEEGLVESRLQSLEEALAFVEENTEPLVSKMLGDALKLTRLALECDSASKEAESIISKVSLIQSGLRAPYLLQHAEAQLRPFFVEAGKLSAKRQERLKALLFSLREQGEAIAKRSRDADAKRALEAFERDYMDEIEKLKAWSPPSVCLRNGSCQQIVESTKKIAQALQGTMLQIQFSALSPRLNELANTLNDIVLRASNAQQILYNRWALQEVREGFDEGKKHTGVIDDEPALGDAMVKRFGPIDMKLINQEVQRCYSEVFELLYQKLDSPSDPKDFDKRGSKLYVLAQMMQTAKVQLSEF